MLFRSVGYQSADLRATLASADTLKVFLHLLIPDYNLDLNLNLEIHIDKDNAFPELARLMGLLERVKA